MSDRKATSKIDNSDDTPKTTSQDNITGSSELNDVGKDISRQVTHEEYQTSWISTQPTRRRRHHYWDNTNRIMVFIAGRGE